MRFVCWLVVMWVGVIVMCFLVLWLILLSGSSSRLSVMCLVFVIGSWLGIR